MVDDIPKIDLGRFKRHKRNLPLGLIFKVLIAIVLIFGLFFINQYLQERKFEEEKNQEPEIQIEIG